MPFCGRLALLQNDVEEASQWLELAGDQEVQGPMLFFEDPSITKAYVLLAKGDETSVAQGQALLTHLLQHVQAMHNTRKTIQVLALQAWAYDLQGLRTEALEVLERALALGCPGGFVRTFADLPPLLKVLAELRRRRKEQQAVDDKLDAYLQAILVAMSPCARAGRVDERADAARRPGSLNRARVADPALARKGSHKQGDCERTGGHTRNSQAAYQACVSQAQRE